MTSMHLLARKSRSANSTSCLVSPQACSNILIQHSLHVLMAPATLLYLSCCGLSVRCVTAPSSYLTGAGQEKELEAINTGDTAWMLVSAAVVLIMTPGKPQTR